MIRVAELFAGVGGFRLGLEGHGEPGDAFYMPSAGDFVTVWANQWEPGSKRRQFAWKCYESHFGKGSCVNRDIEEVLDDYESGKIEIPDFDMLVGGFPCQDYSVSKPAPMARGIEGKKGVLWWSIYRILKLKKPTYVLLENVDRLLKSPTAQRGRDFAIMLCCLRDLGYAAEWMVINAADYGFPQRRRRVYILATLVSSGLCRPVIRNAFEIEFCDKTTSFKLPESPYLASETFGGKEKSPFMSYGLLMGSYVETLDYKPVYDGDFKTLGDVLVSDSHVDERFFVPSEQISRWEYLKGAKREPRKAKNGHEYTYSEGAIAFPDPLDMPSRTILTSEGGSGASRMKHVIIGDSGRLRRLVPDELESLQGFPRGWTDCMTDNKRAFCMGNALVVGIPYRIGVEIVNG